MRQLALLPVQLPELESLQTRLDHAEKIIDACDDYVRSVPSMRPVLTGSVKEMIQAYNRAHGRSLCRCARLPKGTQCEYCHSLYATKGPRRG